MHAAQRYQPIPESFRTPRAFQDAPYPALHRQQLGYSPARPPDRTSAPGPPSADFPAGENRRPRPLPHLPPSCGIGAIGCRGNCWARNPITLTATAVRSPREHEDQGDVNLPTPTSIGTFPGRMAAAGTSRPRRSRGKAAKAASRTGLDLDPWAQGGHRHNEIRIGGRLKRDLAKNARVGLAMQGRNHR